MDEQGKQLLIAAANEIRDLRRQLGAVGARLDAFETAAFIAGYRPQPQGYGEDLAWRIDRFLIDSADGDPDGLAYQRQNVPA
jgi:hypothetical protein